MLKVLIVDGDPGESKLYNEVFLLFGYQVIASLRTSREAIEWFCENDITEFDVVLFDDSVVPNDLEFEGLFQIIQTLMKKDFQGVCIVYADVPRTIEGVTWLSRDGEGIVEELASVLVPSVPA